MDEFNQRRFFQLCNGNNEPAQQDPSLLIERTSEAGSQIYETLVLPEGCAYVRIDIIRYWDDKRGTRVFKRDDSGLVNAAFGVIAVGFVQSGQTYWLAAENMGFDTLLVEIPLQIRDRARVRAAMPPGTTFQIWDTGLRSNN